MLIRTTEELKTVLGAVNKNMSFGSILPYIEQAALTHLVPVLGTEILAELEARLLEDDQTPAFVELLATVRRPLAYFALLEALPFLNVRIGDAGVLEATSANAAPTRQWSYQGVELATAKNAEVFLDAAVRYLETHQAAWPAWSTSEACTLRRGQLMPDAVTLSRYLNLQGSRRAYLAFQPFLERAENLYLRPMVSGDLLDVLKERLMGGVQTPQDTALLQRLRPALAQLALAEALPELSISMAGAGMSVLTDSYVVKQRLSSPQEELERLAGRARTLADRYVTELRQFLDRNVEAYPEYQDSDAYTNPGSQQTYEVPDNAGKPAFWV